LFKILFNKPRSQLGSGLGAAVVVVCACVEVVAIGEQRGATGREIGAVRPTAQEERVHLGGSTSRAAGSMQHLSPQQQQQQQQPTSVAATAPPLTPSRRQAVVCHGHARPIVDVSYR